MSGGISKNWFVICPDNDYCCKICSHVLNDPVRCSICIEDSLFCKTCIEEQLVDTGKCPCCLENSNVEKFVVFPFASKQINKLDVRCDYCSIITPLSNFATHLDYCSEMAAVCECGESILRKDKSQHKLTECVLRLVPCPLFAVGCCESTCCGMIAKKDCDAHICLVGDSNSVGFILKLIDHLKTPVSPSPTVIHVEHTVVETTATENNVHPTAPVVVTPSDVVISAIRKRPRESVVNIESGTSPVVQEESVRNVHRRISVPSVDHINDNTITSHDDTDVEYVACYTYNNGNVYNGMMTKRDHKRHGQGNMKYANGDTYEGEWKDDKRHGKGTTVYCRGTVAKYIGSYLNDQKHGSGQTYYADGNIQYDGSYSHGKYSNKGVMTYANGDKYTGDWLEGLKCGTGTMLDKYGQRYEGKWKDDQKCGQGTMFYVDGNFHKGGWKLNLRHGKGTFFNALKQSTMTGFWKDNLKQGEFTVKYANNPNYANTIKYKDDKFIVQDVKKGCK